MTGVEFLPEDGSPEDGSPEDGNSAPAPVGDHHELRGRPWLLLGAVALLVLAVLWASTRPSGTGPTTKQQAGPTTPHRPTFAATRSFSPDPRSIAPSGVCHGAPYCAATIRYPSQVRRLLQRYLPAAISSLQVRSYLAQSLSTGGTYLADREIDVVGGSVELLITLHRIIGPLPPSHEIVHAPSGTGSALVRRHTSAYVIDLQYLAPETVPPSVAKLRALAIDPRLEAV